MVAWLVTTNAQDGRANWRDVRIVYARSERAACTEARERAAQACKGDAIVTIVSCGRV